MYAKITIGDLYTQVDAKNNVINFLRSQLRFENDINLRRYSKFNVPKWNYLIRKDGLVHTGLADDVVRLLKVNDIKYQIDDQRTVTTMPKEKEIIRGLETFALTPRPYQYEAIFKGLENPRAMFDWATGSGKTILMSALAHVWDKNTLVVCDSKDLAFQLQDDFEEFTGRQIGLIGAGYFNPQQITVGLVSTLTNKRSGRNKKKKIAKFLGSVEYLMFDEVHHSQSKTWRKVARMCKNASIRHGFSGTCFTAEVLLEDGSRSATKDILLKAYTGPVVSSVKTASLVEKGYLSRPKIKFYDNPIYFDGNCLTHAEEYNRIIVEDPERNQLIAETIKHAYGSGEQAICFVDRIQHGHEIVSILENKMGVKTQDIGYVTGSTTSRTERKELIRDFKEKDLPIIIGTVLGEGLNFFARVGINAAGGRSKKNTIQRIGRVLRKDKDPETGDVDTSIDRVVYYYEFADRGHPWFEKHGRERRKVYHEEGHDVEMLEV